MGALSLTASKAVQRKGFGALLAGVFHIPYPNSYRCPYGNPPDRALAWSQRTFLEREFFKRIVDPQEVAAIFIEPIQGEGGYLPAPTEFLRRTATHLPPARHPAGRGRSAERHGPHRKMVGQRPRRHRARYFLRGEGHRLGHAAFRDDRARQSHGLEARRARLHLWRQSRVRRRGAGDDAICSRRSTSKMPARVGGYSSGAHGGLARAPQHRRRCSRQRPDDWRRDRARSENARNAPAICATRSWIWPLRRACFCWAPAKHDSHRAAAGDRRGASRIRRPHSGSLHREVGSG